jgi:hypothetical protein
MGCCYSTRIIRQEEIVALYRDGARRVINGPAKITMWSGMEIQHVNFYSADDKQYLVVRTKDGVTTHVPGPKRIMFDPLVHDDIKQAAMIPIDNGEIIVVNRRSGAGASGSEKGGLVGGTGAVTQIIIRGPCLHMPQPDEWTHEFVWHGSDASNPSKKRAGALRFSKLRIIPDQMYLSIPEVRTADDALMVVDTMIFYELADVDTMLARTHDPIADFMNSCTADVIAFAAGLSYEMFIEKTDMMNNLETYPQLTSRAKSIGFRVTKVVFRGYHATDKLQHMQDDAIQARTQLKLESETEEQAQRLADQKLAKEAERQRKKQEMQRAEIEHNNQLSRLQHEERMAQEMRAREGEGAGQKAVNEEKVAYFRRLKELGVDLTQFLVSQYNRPAELIQVTTDNPGNVHVHTTAGKK